MLKLPQLPQPPQQPSASRRRSFQPSITPPLKSDHWFYRLFQALPDLIRWLPATDADSDSGSGFADQGLAAAGQGLLEVGEDSLYRFSAPELKALSHRLDGLLWPRDSASGSEALPVVILEVQMHPDPVFHHRLAAETFRCWRCSPSPCGRSQS